ncbi:MAG: hypothetical protein JOZ90_09935 [Alphaproteobacteria bacterium]|nr:hypothetical protein [Alphaproteobacteria bacterium]MBV9370500.1 hypothetical protein [Alphaproteobacteria bacterium]MBV9901401.1 hypothetical protein [Alphaproteobacteria bacterium]
MILAGSVAASCHREPDRVLSIFEVVANIDALNGRTVKVGGFLPECGGYDCLLYGSEADGRRVKAWTELARAHRRVPDSELPEGLGIGSDDGFDRKAAPFVGQYVLITGTVDKRCRDHGEMGCTDRAPEIHPKSIRPWQPPAGGQGRVLEKRT